MQDFWVFGYASLMWRPGFEYLEKQRACLFGFHRALCIKSVEHRGTPQRPGLVMGLDRGGSCVGLAFRIAAEQGKTVMDYLRARELVTNVYREHTSTARLGCGSHVPVVTYVADRDHSQYAGRLSVDEAVERVVGAVGNAGPNEEYVLNTADHIRTLGIRDPWLEEMASKLRR